MQHKLEVYIADECPGCDEAKLLVKKLLQKKVNIKIDLLNFNNPTTICPDNIFATPTFVLNGQIIFLGNPSLIELEMKLRETEIK